MKILLILVREKPSRMCKNLNISYWDESSELKVKYKVANERITLNIQGRRAKFH